MTDSTHIKDTKKTKPYPKDWLLTDEEKKKLMSESNEAVDAFAKLYEKKQN